MEGAEHLPQIFAAGHRDDAILLAGGHHHVVAEGKDREELPLEKDFVLTVIQSYEFRLQRAMMPRIAASPSAGPVAGKIDGPAFIRPSRQSRRKQYKRNDPEPGQQISRSHER